MDHDPRPTTGDAEEGRTAEPERSRRGRRANYRVIRMRAGVQRECRCVCVCVCRSGGREKGIARRAGARVCGRDGEMMG